MEDILGVPRGSLKETDDRDTVESWSSLADVQIASYLAVESGNDTYLELIEAETFGDMLRILDEKGVFTV